MVAVVPLFVRLKRGIGADLVGCHSADKTTMIYIYVLNHGSESVRSPVDGL